MIKKLFAFLLITLPFFIPSEAQAFDGIQTSAEVVYRLDPENRVVYVNYQIEITNLTSTSYVNNFNFVPSGLRPENVKAYQDDNQLDVVFVENSYYKIVLLRPAVGVGNKASFSLEFEDRSLYLGTNSSWSFSIPTPKSAQEFKDYILSLVIPENYLNSLFVSPSSNRFEKDLGLATYTFEKEEVLGGPLRVFFGNSQDYSISLGWSLKNATMLPVFRDIKLPPNTPNQIVYLRSLKPRPQSIFKDEFGNTVARYVVGPITEVEVKSVFEITRLFEQNNDKNEINLPEPSGESFGSIDDLSKELKKYEDILTFTTNRLEYGFGTQNARTISADELSKGYSEAFCLDYTKLFSAITKSSGTKVATVIGYIVPPGGSKYRLLGNDLHSWIILENTGSLVSLDPTRYDTGGGDLYKNNVSLDQIAFQIVSNQDEIDYSLLPRVTEVTTISGAAGLAENEFVGSIGIVPLVIQVVVSFLFFGLISIFFVYLLVKHHGKIQLPRRN